MFQGLWPSWSKILIQYCFACFIGKFDSSQVEIFKKIKAQMLKKQLGLMLGVNTVMQHASANGLHTRDTILGTL